MKKFLLILIGIIFSAGVGGYFITNIIERDLAGIYRQTVVLPAMLPSKVVFSYLWIIVLGIAGLSSGIILANPVQINRRKNVFINYLIFLGLMFSWNYLLFISGNLTGILILAIVGLTLSLLVFVMFWLVEIKAGYLMLPAVFWALFLIILSISLKVLN